MEFLPPYMVLSFGLHKNNLFARLLDSRNPWNVRYFFIVQEDGQEATTRSTSRKTSHLDETEREEEAEGSGFRIPGQFVAWRIWKLWSLIAWLLNWWVPFCTPFVPSAMCFDPHWEVSEFRREGIEVAEEDLVEFSTDGILTDINLAGTTSDEELGLLMSQLFSRFIELVADSWLELPAGNAGFRALSASLANKAKEHCNSLKSCFPAMYSKQLLLRGGQSAQVRIAFFLDFGPATGAVGSESNELQVAFGRLSLRRCGLFGSAGFREAC